jgi:hypothetical protein
MGIEPTARCPRYFAGNRSLMKWVKRLAPGGSMSVRMVIV